MTYSRIQKYCLATLLVFICSSVWALEKPQKRIELHLYGGYTALDRYGLAELDNAFAWSTKLSFTFDFRLQLGVAYAQARASSVLGEDATLRSFRFEPTYLFFNHAFSPYVKTIIGHQRVQMEQIDTSSGLMLGAGLGVRSSWNEVISTWMGVDMELSQMGLPIDSPQTNWHVYLGASLHLGPLRDRPNRMSMPLPQTPSPQQEVKQTQTCAQVPTGIAVDQNGCPLDFDRDGIPDYADLCPGTQTPKVDSMGCPLEHFARGVMHEITFEPSSARMTSRSYKHVRKIAGALSRFPQLNFVIEGHTDAIGDESDNITLSQARAIAVKNMLTQAGLSTEKIQVIGYGQQYPLAPNDTEQGRRMNRRVEIKWKAP